MIISVANQKGGVGKSTLCVSFANYLIQNSKELIIIDFDFQSSVYGLWEEQTKIINTDPPYDVISKDLNSVTAVVGMCKDIDQNHIVIFDLPGKLDDDNLLPLFNITDLFLVPFSYDKLSIESTLFFVKLIQHFKKDVQLCFIPNRIKAGVKYKTKLQVDKILSEYGLITPSIPDRVCLQRLSVYNNTEEVTEIIKDVYDTILNKYINEQ
tara:strand:- start:21218 stop:21847 length:630 start_codon:yes stop_codon:yes gene_type:complete